MNGLRILLLRAARLARRSPVRSLATGFLVLIAVLSGSLWLSESRGYFLQNSSVESQLGRADVRYDLFGGMPMPSASSATSSSAPLDELRPALPVDEQVDAVLAALPYGSDVAVLERFGRIDVGTAAISDPVTVHQGPWTDPLLAGMVDLADGRLPGPGEVVVPPSLARSLGVDIGDRLVVRDPVAVLDVVGLGSSAPWKHLVVADGEFVATDAAADGLLSPDGSTSVLATLPAGDPAPTVQVGTEPEGGPVAAPSDRESFGGRPPTGTSTGIVVAITALVGLTAGAAFGIGATRRRRALGLLAANGATQGQLRLAAGAEALVVSIPAAVLGVLVAILAPGAWVRLRLPGWDWMWLVVVPLEWVGLLAVAAVAAAVLGATLFSRAASTATVPALLDSSGPVRRGRPARPRWAGWVLVLAVLAIPLYLPVIGLVGAGQSGTRAWGVLVGLALWCAGVAAVVYFTRRLLARHAVGRLVGRDLARRPLGAGAAVSVIAAWSFAAIVWALTSGVGGDDRTAAFDGGERTGSEFVDVGTVTIRPFTPTSLRQRSSTEMPADPDALSDELREQLAVLGLRTEQAVLGQHTEPCEVCGGARPMVLVLDSIDGLDLPAPTAAALRSGSVVTPIDLDGLDGSTVGGMPITVAPLPFDASAAMLAEFAPDGASLDGPVDVLVGSTSELSDDAAAAVVLQLAEAGVDIRSNDPRLQQITWADANGLGLTDATNRDALWWAVSVGVLVLVTMAVTVSHRREHGEAAHVLWVLGAGPRAGRRLAAITAGSLAATGVMVGATTALLWGAATWLGRTDLDLADVLEPRRVLVMLTVIVLVPAAATLLGSLLPPPRSVRADLRPA